MSVKISGLVWDIQIPRDEKLLMLCYADHANHDGGSIFPSKERVEHMTGYSRRSVQTITAKLIADGLLIEDGRAEKGVVRYRIPVAKLLELAEFPVSACQVCGGTDSLCTHHIQPQAWAGSDGRRNRIRLCRPCHSKMHVIDGEQNLSELGLLLLHEGVEAVREKLGGADSAPRKICAGGAQKTTNGGANSAPNPSLEPPREPSKGSPEGDLFSEPSVQHPEIPPNMRTPELLTAWGEWRQHRKEKRQPLTATAIKKQVAELAGWIVTGGPGLAVAAINHSIKSGYTGLFLPKGAGATKASPTRSGPITSENALRMPQKRQP